MVAQRIICIIKQMTNEESFRADYVLGLLEQHELDQIMLRYLTAAVEAEAVKARVANQRLAEVKARVISI